MVAAARARGVPVVSARQMLTWLDARNASSFGSLAWNGSALSFNLSAGSGATGLQAMLPLRSGTKRLQTLTRGGSAHAFTVQTIKGVDYVVFAGTGGTYVAFYAEPAALAPSAAAALPGARVAAVGDAVTVAAIVNGWGSSVVPTNPSINEALPVELGVKFRTSVSGVVTGIRFYKGAGNTGTHTGKSVDGSGATAGQRHVHQ